MASDWLDQLLGLTESTENAQETIDDLNIPTGFKRSRKAWEAAKPGQPLDKSKSKQGDGFNWWKDLIGPVVKEGLLTLFSGALDWLLKQAGSALVGALTGKNGILGGITNWLGTAWNKLSGWVSGAWKSLTGLAGNVVSGIKGLAGKAIQGITSLAGKAGSMLGKAVGGLGDLAGKALSGIGGVLKGAAGFAGKALAGFGTAAAGAWTGFQVAENVLKPVRETIGGVVKGGMNMVEGALDTVVG